MGRTWDALRRAEQVRNAGDTDEGSGPRSFFARGGRQDPAKDGLFEMMLGDLADCFKEELAGTEERLVERVEQRVHGVDSAVKQSLSGLTERIEREAAATRKLLTAVLAVSLLTGGLAIAALLR